MPPSGAQAYSIRSIALLTETSEKLIRDQIERGKIRAVRIGRCVRVPRSELERLLRPSTHTPAPASLRSGGRPLA